MTPLTERVSAGDQVTLGVRGSSADDLDVRGSSTDDHPIRPPVTEYTYS